MIKEKFDYALIDTSNSTFKDFSFKNILFSEGMGVKENPYFSDIAVNPNKGHHIRVKLSESIPKDITIKKKHFLFPLDDNLHFMAERTTVNNFITRSIILQSHSYKKVFQNFIRMILRLRKCILVLDLP